MACVPTLSRRKPNSGSSSISTSAIIQLVEGSDPTKSMPAALRTRLRPPSQPTRYSRSQRRVAGQLDIDAGVVLGEAHHLAATKDRNAELGDPVGQDRLELALPQRKPVVVAGREVADVQRDPAEPLHLHDLTRREEPLGDAALIEHLDGARVQPAGARSVDLLVGAPFDDGDVDPRQRQLARQHQPGRAASGDHHRVVGLVPCPTTVVLGSYQMVEPHVANVPQQRRGNVASPATSGRPEGVRHASFLHRVCGSRAVAGWRCRRQFGGRGHRARQRRLRSIPSSARGNSRWPSFRTTSPRSSPSTPTGRIRRPTLTAASASGRGQRPGRAR